MNKTVLLGRLTAEPELRQTGNGVPVVGFCIAVDRRAKEKATDWIDIVAWRKTAEFICQYFRKGDPIIVSGELQSRTYEDKDRKKHKVVEVVADSVEFVPKSSSRNEPDILPKNADDPSDNGFSEISDDLPF